MFTYGQAACVILDLKPTDDNRTLVNKTLANSLFEVKYIGSRHSDPFPLAKAFIVKIPKQIQIISRNTTSIRNDESSNQLGFRPRARNIFSADILQELHMIIRNSQPFHFHPVKKNALTLNSKARKNKDRKSSSKKIVVGQSKKVKRSYDPAQTKSNFGCRYRSSTPKKTTTSITASNLLNLLRNDKSIVIKIAMVLSVRVPEKADRSYGPVYATDSFIHDTLEYHIPI
ncbi:hypothetical protein [Parasitella parasitica]|uniref:Uncharacterized protein n=1 Tax=Parasitella parasitica TaxID=35722 RepID=A0A0B7NCN9_9FUNG|nr:hypothetical protein [Parasitella parasitica]